MKCPTCSETRMQTRIKRQYFFKALPKSKAFKCYACETEYIHFIFDIPFKVKGPLIRI